ncbi:tetratricopeptide repeat protein [Spirochaeta cellobiosiphila]|uniref:tetratricopeptide repeat protein n=1 Tax=Spirochaeta cellobiosiphila TaxID=504483 RepID=UPI00040AE0F0|nr:tetratricopeptide repeat protein [Spirochaeta cellobiosiphila]
MKKQLFLIYLLILGVTVYSQSHYQIQFNELIGEGRYEEGLVLLKEWEKAEPNDIEMLIGYGNYYCNVNRQENPSMGRNPEDGKYYAAYLHVIWDVDDIHKAVSYLDEALTLAPYRLDIYLGKNYMLDLIHDTDLMTESILKMLNTQKEDQPNWLWTNNKPLSSIGRTVEDVLVSSVKDRLQYMNRNPVNNKNNIQKIIDAELALYPDNIIFLNIAGNFYDDLGNRNKAINMYNRALEINPKDYIVMYNMGLVYEALGEKEMAKKYYQSALDNATNSQHKELLKKRIQGISQ